jgi:enoyl-CoA hydratase/carnithine racemase
MGRPFRTDTMYRTHLEDYAATWADLCRYRREGGILEIRFHWDDGPWRWNDAVHRALAPMFNDVANDPETECVIITGTGDRFLNEFDAATLERQSAEPMGQTILYDWWWMSQTRMPLALMHIPVPIVGAINGPAVIHPEVALLSDVVICSDTTIFKDTHYTGVGIVPSDGSNILYRALLGMNRARSYLYQGYEIDAQQALELGLVAEVLPPEDLLERAWEIAETVFMRVSRIHRRLSREALIQPWRELYVKELYGSLAHEAWASQDTWPGEHRVAAAMPEPGRSWNA